MADTAISPEQEAAERLVIRGLVQGVGFRPAVWKIARELGIRGTVSNIGDTVEVLAVGPKPRIDEFARSIADGPTPLARIFDIERSEIASVPLFGSFDITASSDSGERVGVVPDAAVCEACIQETFDPFSRRYRYPFTNCTHCGPRFSMIENIPYDRPNTTMKAFEMCTECRSEYEDPSDRRFHAQPIACYKCGPSITVERSDGRAFTSETFSMLDAADAVCTLIQRGMIVAIKGIGGFQLACDAGNDEAVARLRSLKHRERKPFALMARDIEMIREYCLPTAEEEELLRSPASPIVIMERRGADGPHIAASVAPGIRTLGFMLPNTPLHLLILRRSKRPIILTSGNISDEPQCIDDREARTRLGHIADHFVFNDRPIARRVDDSLVRSMNGEVRVIRRARGYAPSPFLMPDGFEKAPATLAYGGELKNTFCLLENGKAIISQHIGDLEDAATQADYRRNLGLYEQIYLHKPTTVACDLHPEYISSKIARSNAEADDIDLIEVQHHHAHIASCMVENGSPIDAAPVLGIALDGLGYGDDGTFWGGEFLLADYRGYRRLGTFKPVAMIGGEQAIREPWRSTYAHITAEMGWERFAMNYSELELFEFLAARPRDVLDGMLTRGLNAPLASSCGRLFDAAAAAAGIARERAAYEGQGAVEFEALVDADAMRGEDELLAYPFAIPRLKASALPYIEPLAMWQALLGDLILGTPVQVIAARFHKGLAKAIVQMAEKLSSYETGNEPVTTVALSGGVWQNKVLFEEVTQRLNEKGFTVLTHRQFPANDGGLSLGQAAVAAARIIGSSRGH